MRRAIRCGYRYLYYLTDRYGYGGGRLAKPAAKDDKKAAPKEADKSAKKGGCKNKKKA